MPCLRLGKGKTLRRIEAVEIGTKTVFRVMIVGGKTEKHLPYFEVLDALQSAKRCPFCELEERIMHRYFEMLFYERVNDAGVSMELARSKGFCNKHAHYLLRFLDSLGTALIYQRQAGIFLNFLEANASRSLLLPPGNLAGAWNTHEPCPACRKQKESRTRHAKTMLKWMEEAEMRAAFEASPGLCVPHFLFIQELAEKGERIYIFKKQFSRTKELLDDLEEMIRKKDYRFSGEPAGKEADAWSRAVEFLTGAQDIF